MVICPMCGAQTNGDICSSCGNQLGNVTKRRESIEDLKTAGSSPLFLTAVVLYTGFVCIQMTQIFNASLLGIIEGILLDGGDLSSVAAGTPFEGIIAGVVMAFSLGLSLLPVLLGVGMWVFYFASRDIQSRSTSGLTMIKVVIIIQYSFIILIMALAFALMALVGSALSSLSSASTYASDSLMANLSLLVILITAAVMLASVILLVFYLIGIVKTINIAIRALKTGVLSGKVSQFVIVMNYIAAGFTVITALTELGDEALLSALGSLLSAAVLVTISICLGSFKRQMAGNI